MKSIRGLSREIVFLFLGYGVNFFGSGMTLPFLIVYFHQIRHISLAMSGIVLSASSVAGMIAAPLTGWLVDKVGTMRVLMISIGVLAVGTAGYAIVDNVWIALMVSALTGIGNTSMWNGLSTRLARLSGDTQRSQVFGIAYAVQNLGLGLGSGVAGFLVNTSSPFSFMQLFFIDAFTYVAFIPFLIVPRKKRMPFSEDRAEEGLQKIAPYKDNANEKSRGYRFILRDGAMLAITSLNLLFVVFGFSQLNSALPAWAASFAGIGTDVIGFAFFANCIGIAIFQVPILHLTANWRRTRAAATAAFGFLVCWAMIYIAGQNRGLWTSTLLISALVVFGLGETFLSPSLAPLVHNLAQEELRGRYSAVYNLSWQLGLIAGPIISGFSLGKGTSSYLFLILATVCGLGGIGAIFIERMVPEAANRGDGHTSELS